MTIELFEDEILLACERYVLTKMAGSPKMISNLLGDDSSHLVVQNLRVRIIINPKEEKADDF